MTENSRVAAGKAAIRECAVVIRTFNKPETDKAVKRALDAGVGCVYVVIDGHKDRGNTVAMLEAEMNDHRVKALEMWEGYNWSPALNYALDAIHVDRLLGMDIKFVINISNEVIYKPQDLHALVGAMVLDQSLGCLSPRFEGVKNGNSYDLSDFPSYRHPRNTCMVIRLEAVGQLGRFSVWCDQLGGMEDIEFILRMKLFSSWQDQILEEVSVKLLIGKNYYQPEKIRREEKAMDKIFLHWRHRFARNTAQRKIIDQVIHNMRLKEEE